MRLVVLMEQLLDEQGYFAKLGDQHNLTKRLMKLYAQRVATNRGQSALPAIQLAREIRVALDLEPLTDKPGWLAKNRYMVMK